LIRMPLENNRVDPSDWIDSKAQVTGVLDVEPNLHRQPKGFELMCPGLAQLRIQDKPPGSKPPLRKIQGLGSIGSAGEREHRVRIIGTITLREESLGIFLQDPSGSILVRMNPSGSAGLAVGDQVEVTGFLGRGDYAYVLEDATAGKLASGLEPRVEPASAEDAAKGLHDHKLIQLEGDVINQYAEAENEWITLQNGRTLFKAQMRKSKEGASALAYQPATRLQLTGVCITEVDLSGQPRAFRLLLRTGRDLKVVSHPSWLSAGRILWVLGAMVLVSVAALGWVAILRNQVQQRTQQIITTNRLAIQEREKLQGQLVQAQKMESVGRLAGGVAHDFNNMLQVILGNVTLAMADAPAEGELREYLNDIHKAALRSSDLTSQLLAFARKQIVSPKNLDLNQAVSSTVKLLQRLIGENIELAWLPGADVWPVLMDATQLDQALANLAVNARDAITGTGRITIETGNVTLEESYPSTQAEGVPGDYVMLVVSDSGAGMSKEVMLNIFEPFYTTKGATGGTGLGLATVYGIVKQNKGWISVYSEIGKGTTFKIYLPRNRAEAERVAEVKPSPTLRGTETILLVEDEEQVRNLTQRMLGQHGYTVLSAGTPAEALALVAQTASPIGLIISDVVMPGMNGKELRSQVLAIHPGLKFLFMSGYTANVIAHHGVLDDGIAFLQKPFTVSTLTAKVREVLASAPDNTPTNG
jgi:signal transduction histidine kinase/CheY-like chemotaxis protein